MISEDALTDAREAHAVCVEIRYRSESVDRLKALLDKVRGAPSEFQAALLRALAEQVRRETAPVIARVR